MLNVSCENMEQTLQHILRELQTLRAELQEVKQGIRPNQQLVEAMLRRRGFCTLKHPLRHHLVLPLDCSKETANEFYHLMQKYSFRIFLRDLIAYSHTPNPDLLTRYCSAQTVQHYLAILLQHHILRQISPSVVTVMLMIMPTWITPSLALTMQ